MNGIIVIDKPAGRTSHDMVYEVRRLTGIRKVGHTGTLDPMATGVLPICVGSATKAADMLAFSDKTYRAELVLGKTTDTQDAEGEVLTESEVTCGEEEIRTAIKGFVGKIEQVPPMYSAIKQNGKKLYELARQGIEVERKSRTVTIHSIDILKIDGARVTMEVSCSKGTYVRTLCADIGAALGTGACMSALRRVKTGMFTLADSHTLESLHALKERGELRSAVIDVEELFTQYPRITLNEKQVGSVTNGVQMTYRSAEGMYRLYDNNGKFLCISELKNEKLKLVKSFWS